ncbi:P-loop containing nucleoside triphosphate hydrolase [Lecanosticta acicola]|uniref:P-loop containing nucleoside triphosphate hydrolase n=1 Tax=Lecanosticta acicola TaxID=111012 RepID=A0AAI8Z3C7_9PEZI|nr:P-loop containing nucleoside triphosphate hydrolase [Lecanosticta acicola]
MTAGTHPERPAAPSKPHNEVARTYFDHSSANRINTDVVLVRALRAEYPDLHLTVVPQASCNILSYASAGHAAVAPIDSAKDRLSWRSYIPPASRLSGKGVLADQLKFGKYLVDWRNKEFVLYIADGRDGAGNYPHVVNQYILSASVEATNSLLMEVGQYGNLLHEEVWVFDQGLWQKSKELWDSVQKSHWEDVILDPKMKKLIRDDVLQFFDSQDTYDRLKVPWKRGIIYYGPPGNGKTISIKAMMNTLYQRDDPVPTLYVRTLSSFAGPEYSLGQIFALARRTAPCLLVFEDLDSMVSDDVRSYFLNEVDGIRKNDGILIVGSTNHLERLDPGIVKRPSRFDRKYLFHNPNEEERTLYMKYWQGKLADNHDLEFPDKLCPAVAKITKSFSFAYLQEAMVASLLAIARDEDDYSERTCLECLDAHAAPTNGSSCDRASVRPFKGLYDLVWEVRRIDEGDSDLENYVLWREIKKQVRALREEMGDDDSSKK